MKLLRLNVSLQFRKLLPLPLQLLFRGESVVVLDVLIREERDDADAHPPEEKPPSPACAALWRADMREKRCRRWEPNPHPEGDRILIWAGSPDSPRLARRNPSRAPSRVR